MQKRLASITLAILICSQLALAQQVKNQRPSPTQSADCKFSDGKTIHVDYSSPRMKGRKIFGGLVPYGEVWRTGANEATAFVTTANLTVGGKDVPAGNYTIFTVPGPDKWSLIINKKTGEWGIPYKWQGDELLRTDMAVSKPTSAVENFTIALDPAGGKCTMRMEWENTRVTVDFEEKK
jgi:hypothetical protein